jgi:hypothetical protein
VQKDDIGREVDTLERIDVAVGDDVRVDLESGRPLQIGIERLDRSAGPPDDEYTGQHGVDTTLVPLTVSPMLSAGRVAVKVGDVMVTFNPGMKRGML